MLYSNYYFVETYKLEIRLIKIMKKFLFLIIFFALCGLINGCANSESELHDNIAEAFDITATPVKAMFRQVDHALDDLSGGLSDEDYEDFVD